MGAGFAFRHETAVRLRDLDGLGHVNNAAIVTYLEDARTLYLLGRRGKSSIADFDFILARTEIDYRAPAFLHERLEILVKPKRIGSKSFELEYRVNSLDTVNSLNSVNSLNKGRLVPRPRRPADAPRVGPPARRGLTRRSYFAGS
jgi:YbgC/YbaW family acyl-CoA thioester hydrolase